MQKAQTALFQQYLVSVSDPSSVTAEQFRVLHARLEQFQKTKGCKVFCVTSAIPGEGKTFITVNLGVTGARDFGKRTLLMDVDCRMAQLQKLAGRGDQVPLGWADVVLKNNGFHEALIPFTDEKLFVLPVGKIDHPSSSLITSLGSSALLDDLRKEFDYIVMDGPPILPLADMRLLEDLVDGIILVVRAEGTTRDVLVKAITHLHRDKILGLVLNDVKQDSSRYYYYYHSSVALNGDGTEDSLK